MAHCNVCIFVFIDQVNIGVGGTDDGRAIFDDIYNM